jgi:hypothetical protein
MSARWSFGLILFSAACGGTDVKDFPYGGGQPGVLLPEGGEIRHENVRILGFPEQTWIQVYQYTAGASVPTAPFAAPADHGNGPFGNCVDERSGSPTWPFHPITGATYLNLTKVLLTGAGIPAAGLNVIKTDPANTVGNSTLRTYGFTYGGGAPGNPPSGFNGTLTKEMSTADTDYTLDIGKGQPMSYHMPAKYTAPLGIGGAAKVMITDHKDLEFTWTAPVNDKGASGNEHLKTTYFNFTFFADPSNATNPAQFICFPDVDGHQLVPKSVIEALPASGLIVNADLSHYMESREAATGEMRRFDLVSIYCNISQYQKQ